MSNAAATKGITQTCRLPCLVLIGQTIRFLHNADGKTQENFVLRISCFVTWSSQREIQWSFEQLGLMKGVSACGRRVGLDDFCPLTQDILWLHSSVSSSSYKRIVSHSTEPKILIICYSAMTLTCLLMSGLHRFTDILFVISVQVAVSQLLIFYAGLGLLTLNR